MSFEINTVADAPSAWVDLKHPVTGELLGASFELAGPEHPKRKALEFARQRKMRAALQKAGKMAFDDPEEEAQTITDNLAALTLDWKGVTDKGVDVPYSAAAAAKLYTTTGLGWLRDQLLRAVNERDRFITSSAAS